VGSSLFPIVLGSRIPYQLDVKNTGNIHYFAYFSASIDSLFYHEEPTGTSRLLMPGAIRHIEQTLPAPTLPGIYKVTYGYKPDQGETVKRTSYVLNLPPWFILLLAVIALAGAWLYGRRRPATGS
jgi:hypothetical protein